MATANPSLVTLSSYGFCKRCWTFLNAFTIAGWWRTAGLAISVSGTSGTQAALVHCAIVDSIKAPKTGRPIVKGRLKYLGFPETFSFQVHSRFVLSRQVGPISTAARLSYSTNEMLRPDRSPKPTSPDSSRQFLLCKFVGACSRNTGMYGVALPRYVCKYSDPRKAVVGT